MRLLNNRPIHELSQLSLAMYSLDLEFLFTDLMCKSLSRYI